MSNLCLYQHGTACHDAPATHRVVSPLHQPGVWNIFAAEPEEPAEFCLGCAMRVAQHRKEAWHRAQEARHGLCR